MSDENATLNTIPLRFGRGAALVAIEQRIRELQARVELYNELMREEPEFRYEHEMERDWLLGQISLHRFEVSRLAEPAYRHTA